MKRRKKLKRILFEDGKTQRELAKQTGIHESLISHYNSGRFNLDEMMKAKIAVVLGRTEEEIFDE